LRPDFGPILAKYGQKVPLAGVFIARVAMLFVAFFKNKLKRLPHFVN
jgi:hypothetical protein